MKRLLLAMAVAGATVAFGEDLPWIYETAAHPADDVTVDRATADFGLGALRCVSGEAAIDSLATFEEQSFQVDGLTYLFKPGFLLFLR